MVKKLAIVRILKNPAEFRINEYVKPGINKLAVKIFRWSTGSYLEAQDFWRMSGIERDVYLWSQPNVSLRDFRVKSTLDDSYKTEYSSWKCLLRITEMEIL